MSKVKKLLTAGATFSAALGIGFVMQNGDALAAKFGSTPPPPQAAAEPAPLGPVEVVLAIAPDAGPVLMEPHLSETTTVVSVPLDDRMIARPAPAAVQLASLESMMAFDALPTNLPRRGEEVATLVASDAPLEAMPLIETVPASDPLAVAEPMDCGVTMSATLLAGAMVDLAVSAPCNPGSEFVLHHQGMMLTYLTDGKGNATVTIPALGKEAVFVAAFADGVGDVANLTVPDFDLYDRAVLQWQGDVAVQMQVYEFGAAFGEDGHVWAESPRDPTALDAGKGYLVELGATESATEPYRAQVYTFPAGTSAQSGDILVGVEAEITSGNCGRDISAQSIQVTSGAEASGQDLVMTMPDCDAVGDLLALDAMFTEFTVASAEGSGL